MSNLRISTANSYAAVRRDRNLNSVRTTKYHKIPISNGPGMEGDIIVNRTTGQFCWHDGRKWCCITEGTQGPQGDTGAQGPQGDTGAQGSQGGLGDTGAQGLQGGLGDTGAQGLQGGLGDTGAQGLQGGLGDTGAQGPQGNDGAQGPQGDQGDTGPQGDQGDTGAQGPQGYQGPQGDQGDTSAQGPQGDPGSTGSQGSQGDPGSTGSQGSQGDPGSTGSQGDTGAQGPQGDPGDTGAQGPQGDPGGGTLTVFSNSSEGTSSTTGTSFTQKLRLTFTANASDYLIQWYCEGRSTDSGTRVEIRVDEDDTTTLASVDYQPDTGSSEGYGPNGGLVVRTLSAASHDFDLDFSSSQGGKEVRVRRARITATEI